MGRAEGKCFFNYCEGQAEKVELGEGGVPDSRPGTIALDFDYDNHIVSRTDLNFLPQQ